MTDSSPYARRVEATLRALAQKLERCAVIDAELRDSIVEAHRDGGMPEDAAPVVVLRRPASTVLLAELNALVLSRFRRGLPPDLRALLARHDGLWMGEVESPNCEELLAIDHWEEGVFATSTILGELRSELSTDTAPDGPVTARYRPVLPFFEVPDQGWHALDFTRATAAAGVPVVTYWFDEESETTEDCEVIADSFATWFERWVTSGFDPFWYEPR